MSVYILAEIASAHMGDPELCLELIHKAKEAGADGVKVQVWFPEEGDFSHMMDKFMGEDGYRLVLREISGIDMWAEIYGDKGLSMASHLSWFKFRYRPHTSFWERRRYSDRLWAASPQVSPSSLINGLIIGRQDYPTLIKNARLSNLLALGRVGYADHTQAGLCKLLPGLPQDSIRWDFVIPAMAIAAGATLIEKHICLDREKLKERSKDWVSALEPHEFKEFVEFIREAETAL